MNQRQKLNIATIDKNGTTLVSGLTRPGRWRWRKRHESTLNLTLTLFSIFLAVGLTVYTINQAALDRKHIESQNDAIFRALSDIFQGGTAQPILNSDGTYTVKFDRAVSDSLSFSDCVQVTVIRANGTIETSPNSC